jgi:hypothetical protein
MRREMSEKGVCVEKRDGKKWGKRERAESEI